MHVWSRTKLLRLFMVLLMGYLIGNMPPSRAEDPAPWQAYALGLLSGAITGLLVRRLIHGSGQQTQQQILRAKTIAENISQQKWYLKSAVAIDRGEVWQLDSRGWRYCKFSSMFFHKSVTAMNVELATFDARRMPFKLTFPSGHPSTRVVRELDYLSVVELDLYEESIQLKPSPHVAAYVVIKTES